RMIRRIWIAALVASLCGHAAAQTAGEIIDKHIAARGGLEKIKAMKTVRMTGQLDLGGGQMAVLVSEQKRPNVMRMDMLIGPMVAVRAYDGKHGWIFMPQMGHTQPQPMSDDDLKDALEEADIDTPLVDYKAKGNNVEFVGREAVEGHDCYRLRLTLKNGDVRDHFIDSETFLDIRSQGGRKGSDGEESTFVQTVSDFREVDGVIFPHLSVVEVTQKGQAAGKFTYKIERIEINIPIDDEHFRMPASQPSK
ncbi:MAG: outer membrane lipoprotein-sorting protein, partial [Tepidisphaeraceae bacterium]